ncbi:MAG: hypothetical protein KGO82_00910 [Bacteroidota bacterium]|nr:hypothetical protein [Bacteroidota bacterium]
MKPTKLKEGVDFYYSPEGYMVFTEQYHLNKGFCCGNGCRHCPFNYESVPEPQRSQLLETKRNNSAGNA